MNNADSQRYAEATRKVEDVTAQFRLQGIVENIIRNLPNATRYPQHGVAFRGTAIVCGAGPSLTQALPSIRECVGKVPIIAVNTAAPALGKAGIPIDVLISIESLDLSKHIRGAGKVGTVVLDLMANPSQWAAAEEIGARTAWILEAATHTATLAYALGVEPHQSGGFGTSAALELARLGGASEIVLVGADLGYPSGKAYADGSGWGGLQVQRDGERLKFEGREDRDATHVSGGVPPLPRDRPLYDVPAWGGEGTIPTVVEFVGQRDWIAAWNRSVLESSGVRLVNASVGGANIMGVSELSPAQALANRSGRAWPAGQPVLPESLKAVREAIRAEASAAREIARHFTGPTAWPSDAFGAPVHMSLSIAAHDWIMLRDAARDGVVPLADAMRGQYMALAAAADRVEELLDGAEAIVKGEAP